MSLILVMKNRRIGIQMKIEKIVEAIIGAYLVLPSIEDVATGGITLVPSAAVGLVLIADAFGVKI